MNPVQTIQSFFKTESLQKASIVPLKPGQLFYGRVEKFFPNNTALIQLGNLKLYAHLNASLSKADSYWFEVHSNDNGEIYLKVLEGKGQNINPQSTHSLLNQFQLPENKMNVQLLQVFISKNLPFTKEHLIKAANWIDTKTDFAKGLTALEFMIKKDLPFTEQTFRSLVAVQESESFYSQLQQLSKYLEEPKFASLQTIQQLKQAISNILGNGLIDQSQKVVKNQFFPYNGQLDDGTEIKQILKYMIQSLGLEYEKEVNLWSKANQDSLEPLHSLKPLLMSAMTELGNSGRELEAILNRLTGMQLLSQDINGPTLQILMQLPISFGEKQSDVTIQWSGRKRRDGQIDSDYCRVLFYLELKNINQTVVDMQVQNKVIHLTVINDTKEIEPIVTILKPKLKEKLESLGYTLSFIKVIPSFGEKNIDYRRIHSDILSKETYQGVDIKI